MRRKKRYKHATIGKKKYYFYKIIWEDPCGDAGHADIDEMKKLKPAIMISQAYIFAKDKKHVWTFSSYDFVEVILLFTYGCMFISLFSFHKMSFLIVKCPLYSNFYH